MSDRLTPRHGLEPMLATWPNEASDDVGVTIEIHPELGHINLRGDPGNAEFVSTVQTAADQELPILTNTMTIERHRIFCLGPNEWLIVTPIEGTGALLNRLRDARQGLQASATEVSGGQTLLQLAGKNARDILAKGCTLDFHPGKFKVCTCAQSGLAKTNILIGLLDDQPTYEIVVRRSFAEYLLLWLKKAAKEYDIELSTAHPRP